MEIKDQFKKLGYDLSNSKISEFESEFDKNFNSKETINSKEFSKFKKMLEISSLVVNCRLGFNDPPIRYFKINYNVKFNNKKKKFEAIINYVYEFNNPDDYFNNFQNNY